MVTVFIIVFLSRPPRTSMPNLEQYNSKVPYLIHVKCEGTSAGGLNILIISNYYTLYVNFYLVLVGCTLLQSR